MEKGCSKKQAHKYNDLDWRFSSSILWEKISTENPTSFNLSKNSKKHQNTEG